MDIKSNCMQWYPYGRNAPEQNAYHGEKNADQVKMHARHKQIFQDEENCQTHVLPEGKQR